MNQLIKEKWVAALRSGKYEQAIGKLECDGKFCCLGILSQLAVEEGIITKEPYSTEEKILAFGKNGETALLPPEVSAWSGLHDRHPAINGGAEKEDYLACMNDAGVPFSRIADIIEANF